jgi:hypothetical protein
MKRMMAGGLIYIDPKCGNLLQALESWQHGQHEPDILAATRYGIDALIRAGKLLPPVRQNVPIDPLAYIKQLGERDRRAKALHESLAQKQRRGPGPVFKFY